MAASVQSARHPSRRSISREELRIWRDYLETGDVLRSRLASRLQSVNRSLHRDYAVLLALSEAPDHRLRASALAEAIEWNGFAFIILAWIREPIHGNAGYQPADRHRHRSHDDGSIARRPLYPYVQYFC